MQAIRILTDVHSTVESPPALNKDRNLRAKNFECLVLELHLFQILQREKPIKRNFARAFARLSVARVPPHVPLQQIDPTFKQLSLLQAISKLMTSTNHYIY